jgi:hypothetical protein
MLYEQRALQTTCSASYHMFLFYGNAICWFALSAGAGVLVVLLDNAVSALYLSRSLFDTNF